jgi:hypothetical protein
MSGRTPRTSGPPFLFRPGQPPSSIHLFHRPTTFGQRIHDRRPDARETTPSRGMLHSMATPTQSEYVPMNIVAAAAFAPNVSWITRESTT